MPTYAFTCDHCDTYTEVYRPMSEEVPNNPHCAACNDATMRRLYSFSAVMSMPDHYNPTTGTYVSNEQSFKDDLKRASERATIRTGIEHNFVPTDPTDMKSVGVTHEGLDTTYDAADPQTRKNLSKYI